MRTSHICPSHPCHRRVVISLSALALAAAAASAPRVAAAAVPRDVIVPFDFFLNHYAAQPGPPRLRFEHGGNTTIKRTQRQEVVPRGKVVPPGEQAQPAQPYLPYQEETVTEIPTTMVFDATTGRRLADDNWWAFFSGVHEFTYSNAFPMVGLGKFPVGTVFELRTETATRATSADARAQCRQQLLANSTLFCPAGTMRQHYGAVEYQADETVSGQVQSRCTGVIACLRANAPGIGEVAEPRGACYIRQAGDTTCAERTEAECTDARNQQGVEIGLWNAGEACPPRGTPTQTIEDTLGPFTPVPTGPKKEEKKVPNRRPRGVLPPPVLAASWMYAQNPDSLSLPTHLGSSTEAPRATLKRYSVPPVPPGGQGFSFGLAWNFDIRFLRGGLLAAGETHEGLVAVRQLGAPPISPLAEGVQASVKFEPNGMWMTVTTVPVGPLQVGGPGSRPLELGLPIPTRILHDTFFANITGNDFGLPRDQVRRFFEQRRAVQPPPPAPAGPPTSSLLLAQATPPPSETGTVLTSILRVLAAYLLAFVGGPTIPDTTTGDTLGP